MYAELQQMPLQKLVHAVHPLVLVLIKQVITPLPLVPHIITAQALQPARQPLRPGRIHLVVRCPTRQEQRRHLDAVPLGHLQPLADVERPRVRRRTWGLLGGVDEPELMPERFLQGVGIHDGSGRGRRRVAELGSGWVDVGCGLVVRDAIGDDRKRDFQLWL
jgi:hypothetical protein